MSAYTINPNKPITSASVYHSDQALKLWLDFFLDVGDPIISDSSGEDYQCYFCGSFSAIGRDVVEHETDCIFVRARDLMLKNEYVVTTKDN